MKLCVKHFSLLVTVGIVLALFPLCVSAESVNPTIELPSLMNIASVCSDANVLSQNTDRKFDFLSYTVNARLHGCNVEVNMTEYALLSNTAKESVMNGTLQIISDSTLASQSKTRLYNFVAEQDTAVSSLVRQLAQDTKSDFATAYSWLQPFSGTVSTIFGLLAILIFLFLGVTILIDVSYIVLPPIRLMLDKDSTNKPSLISNEAFSSIKESESDSNNYKNAIALYFRKKTIQLVIIGVCLLYLVSGKLYMAIGWVIDSFAGV